MNGGERVRQDVNKVAALITTARRLLAGGALVDLSALEGKVRGICEATATLAAEDGRALRPSLQALVDGLDHLIGELRIQRDRVTQGPGG